MTGDMGGRPPEGRDHETHVVGKVIDGVAGRVGRRIAQAVAPEVGHDRETACFRQRGDLLRPGLRAFWKSVQEDEHLAAGRTVDHRPEAEAVGLNHVLARGHVIDSSTI